MRTADLHMHTKASDGTDTLDKRIEDAKRKGLDAIAVTDHDAVNEGLKGRRFTAENGLEVITGTEIKCEIEGRKIEILAYFIDPEAEEIQQLFRDLSMRREERMEKFVRNLNHSHGLELEAEEVKERAEGNVGRPHLAETLVEEGIVDSVREAFDRFIGEEHDEYVAVDKMDAGKVIDAVHRNGGVTSLAHPGRSLAGDAEEKLSDLKSEGLDAVEVEYSYGDKRSKDSYSVNFGEDKASELAEKLDLLRTGGSDCHGSGSDKYLLGDVRIPYSRVEALKQVSDV